MSPFKGKMIIITAPSGAGKTTIVHHLLQSIQDLDFSVSATSRARRNWESEGKDYYFIGKDAFLAKIEEGAFAEYEEVYPGQYYGTLKSEIERIWGDEKHIVFDIDVKGASRLKEIYPDKSLAIFIKPPSVEELLKRLVKRGSESQDSLNKRIRRAKKELSYEHAFDEVVLNDNLKTAVEICKNIVKEYILN